jgi:hypothetical protein
MLLLYGASAKILIYSKRSHIDVKVLRPMLYVLVKFIKDVYTWCNPKVPEI